MSENEISEGRIALVRPGRGTGRPLRRAIADQLGAAIVRGDFAPGDILSSEVEFARTLDVSRSAFREAVRELAAKGLVESRTKAGTRVLPREQWNMLDPTVLAWAFSETAPDMQFVRSLFELRAIVEPAAAALAAARRSPADVELMGKALAAMKRHTLATDDGRAADRTFHNAILRATHNDAIVTLSAGIGAAVNWTTVFKQRVRALPRDPIPDHARVFDAIVEQDAEAARDAMRVLVDLALEDTRMSMAD